MSTSSHGRPRICHSAHWAGLMLLTSCCQALSSNVVQHGLFSLVFGNTKEWQTNAGTSWIIFSLLHSNLKARWSEFIWNEEIWVDMLVSSYWKITLNVNVRLQMETVCKELTPLVDISLELCNFRYTCLCNTLRGTSDRKKSWSQCNPFIIHIIAKRSTGLWRDLQLPWKLCKCRVDKVWQK